MRNINIESGLALPVSEKIVEKFYNDTDFDTVYNELERFMKILEFIRGETPDSVTTEAAIGYLFYASTVAAHTRPKSNELDGNN